MDDEVASPEQRLYDAATRWAPDPHWGGPQAVIDAAVECLVAGLDSPHLRELAGASPSDRADEIEPLLDAALDELGIPRPGQMSPWRRLSSGGHAYSRSARDRARFEIRPIAGGDGHELLVYLNDVEVTRQGAGLGMNPFAVLVPDNLLVATDQPRQVAIARCECGEVGCGSTIVTIVRDGDVVHWDAADLPALGGGATFRAEEYDAEVTRIAADHGWERPEDTAARLVLVGADRTHLAEHGLRLDWVARDFRDHDRLLVALFTGSEDWESADPAHQVFLRFPRAGLAPEEVAAAVLDVLRRHPAEWSATWHLVKPGVEAPPPMAGPAWTREPFAH